MMGTWWIVWLAFMVVFLALPLGYGSGYRGWGAPFPRYLQRRRGKSAAVVGGPTTFNHQAWGLGGDFVWLALIVGVIWLCLGVMLH